MRVLELGLDASGNVTGDSGGQARVREAAGSVRAARMDTEPA